MEQDKKYSAIVVGATGAVGKGRSGKCLSW